MDAPHSLFTSESMPTVAPCVWQSPTEEHVVDPENDIHNTPTDECYAFSFEEEAWEQIEFVGELSVATRDPT